MVPAANRFEMRRGTANLLLLFIAVIWGSAFLFQKTAMDHIGPWLFLASRSFLAALTLFPLALRENRKRAQYDDRIHNPAEPEALHPSLQPPRRFWLMSVAGGMVLFLAAVLQQTGMVNATVTNSGFLTCLYVILTPFLMRVVLRRRLAGCIWPITGLSILGAWFLNGGTTGGFSAGEWLIILSSVFWAAQILVLDWVARYRRPITYTAIQFAVAGLLAGLGVYGLEPFAIADLIQVWPEIVFVGFVSSAFTFTILAVALQHTSAIDAAILVSLESVFAALAGVLFQGERLAWPGWLGAGLMLVACILIQVVPAMQKKASE